VTIQEHFIVYCRYTQLPIQWLSGGGGGDLCKNKAVGV
jgi:hypothetical protein